MNKASTNVGTDIDRLLGRAVAIARDAAIGETGMSSVVVVVDHDRPWAALFIDSDQDVRSRMVVSDSVREFLEERGAEQWLMICEAELHVPGLMPETDLLSCVAYDRGDERSVLLRVERDGSGLIRGLSEVQPIDPAAMLAAPCTRFS